MPDSDRILERKKREQLIKLKEWDAIIPDNAFVDANVKEELTGKHVPKITEAGAKSASSLEQ